MGIMTRLLRLCKADAHGVMDQLEDKGLLLKQYLREMEASLGNKERQVSALTQNLSRLTAVISRHVEEMDKLERDLVLALTKERDDIARMLIRKRRRLETAAGHLNEQIERMTQEKTQLLETLAHQRLQYDSLSAETDAYCRRASDRQFEQAIHPHSKTYEAQDPSDEEIDLELLERKAALQKGATP
jgi:phage shock protein A